MLPLLLCFVLTVWAQICKKLLPQSSSKVHIMAKCILYCCRCREWMLHCSLSICRICLKTKLSLKLEPKELRCLLHIFLVVFWEKCKVSSSAVAQASAFKIVSDL